MQTRELIVIQNLTRPLARGPARKLQLGSIAGNKQQAAKQLKNVCDSVASNLEMPLITRSAHQCYKGSIGA